MKKLVAIIISLSVLVSCGPDKPATQDSTHEKSESAVEEVAEHAVDASKGIGQIKNVALHTPIEMDRVNRGKAIYEMKCSACHKLTDQRVVGPGWLNVTKNRKPEWIMNMILNVDVMLDQDPEAQKLLELCLTRMPNQNVSVGDARDILEFMRQNDGEK
jgi:mono/diheme cytochrome c family protein